MWNIERGQLPTEGVIGTAPPCPVSPVRRDRFCLHDRYSCTGSFYGFTTAGQAYYGPNACTGPFYYGCTGPGTLLYWPNFNTGPFYYGCTDPGTLLYWLNFTQ